jgi:hypothetical protein
MTAAGPATSTVLSPLPDPRTAVATGAGGPAGIGPSHRPSAGGERLARCSRPHQRRTALSDFIAPFFGRLSEV